MASYKKFESVESPVPARVTPQKTVPSKTGSLKKPLDVPANNQTTKRVFEQQNPSLFFGISLQKTTYALGEKVSGVVRYTNPADKAIFWTQNPVSEVFGVQVFFIGEETVIAEGKTHTKKLCSGNLTLFGKRRNVSYEGGTVSQNKQFPYEKNLYHTLKGGKNHDWKFSFNLPTYLPPTVDTQGHNVLIAYRIYALLDIPWGHSPRATRLLNLGIPYVIHPEIPPKKFEDEKKYPLATSSNVLSQEHAIKVIAWLEQPCISTKDKQTIYLRVHNNSGKNIKGFRLKIKRVIEYLGKQHVDELLKPTFTGPKKSFPLGTGFHKLTAEFKLPDDLEYCPTVVNASLCKVEYYLKVRAVVKFAGDLELKLPFIVASFPPKKKGKAEVEKHSQKPKPSTKSEQKVEQEKVEETHGVSTNATRTSVRGLAPLIDFGDDEFEKKSTLSRVQEENVYSSPTPTRKGQNSAPEAKSPLHTSDDNPFAFAAFSFQEDHSNETTFKNSLQQISDSAHDLEVAGNFASIGVLGQNVELDPKHQFSLQALIAVSKSLWELVPQLLNQAVAQQSTFVSTVLQAVTLSAQIQIQTKIGASFIGDSQDQVALLQTGQTLMEQLEDFLRDAREAEQYNPQGEIAQDFLIKKATTSAEQLRSDCVNVVKGFEAAVQVMKERYIKVTERKKLISDRVTDFDSQKVQEKISADQFIEICNTLRKESEQFLRALFGPHGPLYKHSEMVEKNVLQFLIGFQSLKQDFPQIGTALPHAKKVGFLVSGFMLACQGQLEHGRKKIDEQSLMGLKNQFQDISESLKQLTDEARKLNTMPAILQNTPLGEAQLSPELFSALDETVSKNLKMLKSEKVKSYSDPSSALDTVDSRVELITSSIDVLEAVENLSEVLQSKPIQNNEIGAIVQGLIEVIPLLKSTVTSTTPNTEKIQEVTRRLGSEVRLVGEALEVTDPNHPISVASTWIAKAITGLNTKAKNLTDDSQDQSPESPRRPAISRLRKSSSLLLGRKSMETLPTSSPAVKEALTRKDSSVNPFADFL